MDNDYLISQNILADLKDKKEDIICTMYDDNTIIKYYIAMIRFTIEHHATIFISCNINKKIVPWA